ncbi:hypothetical protein FEM48_Zijuj11G0132400 [Ziziphus jujuba var. spinosa]|uniref:pyridoxal 5'-phosphate synthase n=1 Tax=Ziziphus jujuba var. spinosa TaxID=714518 RepID=A0A978UJ52_ZIZJJ|nr:hypothetical protein FEM48_Zijuj11G0132400 [Ziziphus jujuba var. spinosa]
MGTVTAPWKQLVLEAMDSNAHLKNSSFFQLIKELKHCPFAELLLEYALVFLILKICWYFADSWEQFRIKGTIEIIDESSPDPVNLQQREKSWFARSPRTKMLFLDPGHSYLEEEPPKDAFTELCGGPVAAYCVLVLHPEQVDYLNLKSNQRQVFTFNQNAKGDKCWTLKFMDFLE